MYCSRQATVKAMEDDCSVWKLHKQSWLDQRRVGTSLTVTVPATVSNVVSHCSVTAATLFLLLSLLLPLPALSLSAAVSIVVSVGVVGASITLSLSHLLRDITMHCTSFMSALADSSAFCCRLSTFSNAAFSSEHLCSMLPTCRSRVACRSIFRLTSNAVSVALFSHVHALSHTLCATHDQHIHSLVV